MSVCPTSSKINPHILVEVVSAMFFHCEIKFFFGGNM